MKKIVLAGGSGYLGSVLANYFSSQANEIIILSRRPQRAVGNIRTLVWDGKSMGNWAHALEGADVLINLTGKSVNCRYTKANRQAILNSRIQSVKVLGEALRSTQNGPEVWIQCASATIYRHATDRFMDEFSGELGDGFSVSVCKAWEEAFEQEDVQTRKVILRLGLVLGKHDGVYLRFKNLVRFGLGGKQGNGNQFISWIHEYDVASMIDFIVQHKALAGIYNCTSPQPLKNQEFMSVMRKKLMAQIGLPAPSWLLTIGAFIIGTETELILKSRWVMPSRIINEGYTFKYPELSEAIEAIEK